MKQRTNGVEHDLNHSKPKVKQVQFSQCIQGLPLNIHYHFCRPPSGVLPEDIVWNACSCDYHPYFFLRSSMVRFFSRLHFYFKSPLTHNSAWAVSVLNSFRLKDKYPLSLYDVTRIVLNEHTESANTFPLHPSVFKSISSGSGNANGSIKPTKMCCVAQHRVHRTTFLFQFRNRAEHTKYIQPGFKVCAQWFGPIRILQGSTGNSRRSFSLTSKRRLFNWKQQWLLLKRLAEG